MNIDAYLARLGYSGSRGASVATLRRLHELHLLTVPFENLDIGRRPIVIDEESFVRKIVDEHRGGFCYELNGGFALLLRSLGFAVQLLSAGVAREEGGFGPEFDHLALLVTIDGERWLADVGFGDSFVAPLRFEPGLEQVDAAGEFRITDAEGAFVLERRRGGAWEPQYRFTLTPHGLEEFADRCHYHQTSPLSSFTRKTVCSMATPTGRVTLSGLRMITTVAGERTERDLDEREWQAALGAHFGITLPSASS